MPELTPLKKVSQLAWRRFLLSDPGIEGQLVLRERAPSVGIGDQHNIIFQAGIVEGWKRCIEAMHGLVAVDQVKPEDLENR